MKRLLPPPPPAPPPPRCRLNFPKRGRPSTDVSFSVSACAGSGSEPPKQLRSAAPQYDPDHCIICQKEGGVLHQVMTKGKGLKFLRVAAKLTDRNFFIRLNSLSDHTDAVSNDVQYHQLCWIYTQRDAQPPKDKVLNQKHCVIADIEILNASKCELTNPTGVPMNMNNINATYNLLNENQYEYTGNDYKKHLKQLILENIPNIELIKPKCRNESEKICVSATKDAVVDAFENVEENIGYLFQTGKMIREEEGKREQWSFDGSF